jgi:hypothetical protein
MNHKELKEMKTIMQSFWDQFAASNITQFTITVIVLGGWVYMLISGQPTTALMDTIVGVIVGFYFGTKTVGMAQSIAKQASDHAISAMSALTANNPPCPPDETSPMKG